MYLLNVSLLILQSLRIQINPLFYHPDNYIALRIAYYHFILSFYSFLTSFNFHASNVYGLFTHFIIFTKLAHISTKSHTKLTSLLPFAHPDQIRAYFNCASLLHTTSFHPILLRFYHYLLYAKRFTFPNNFIYTSYLHIRTLLRPALSSFHTFSSTLAPNQRDYTFPHYQRLNALFLLLVSLSASRHRSPAASSIRTRRQFIVTKTNRYNQFVQPI